MKKEPSTYKDAGVNIDLAHDLLGKVRHKISLTRRPEVIAPADTFGGLFQLDLGRYQDPVLVSSIDGVGTKLLVAEMMNDHSTIGHDLVNHCINDIACQGAEPLYFMDYLGIGKLRSPLYEEVLSGLAEACMAQGVSLLGGETAEMPGMYGNDYDLVGVITGVVAKSRIISGKAIISGDTILGLGSTGLHTNGYSLARKVLFEDGQITTDTLLEESGETVGQGLLKPHRCYWPEIKAALALALEIRGIAHITGGGFYDNISRVLPANMDAQINDHSLPCPEIFRFIREKGKIADREMYRVFNMGVGMVWILPASQVDAALKICAGTGVPAAVIGEIVSGSGKVRINGIDDGTE